MAVFARMSTPLFNNKHDHYNHTDKGLARDRRYNQSPKGIIRRQRFLDKHGGTEALWSREYYWRLKEKIGDYTGQPRDVIPGFRFLEALRITHL